VLRGGRANSRECVVIRAAFPCVGICTGPVSASRQRTRNLRWIPTYTEYVGAASADRVGEVCWLNGDGNGCTRA
jgi:hypothetical protein